MFVEYIYHSFITDKISNNNKFIKFSTSPFDPDMDDVMTIINEKPITSAISSFFGVKQDNKSYYVRLGTFLKFLQQYITAGVYKKGSNQKTPLLFFDTDPNTNVMILLTNQPSFDPRICFINRKIAFTKGDPFIYGPSKPKNSIFNSVLNTAITDRGFFDYCNIMNIYLEMGFVLNKIFSLKDDKGNLSLIEFLKGITSGINEALGGVNDFDVFLDDSNNSVKIIDKNPLPKLGQVIDTINTNFPSSSFNNNKSLNSIPKSSIFNLFGYKSDPNQPTAGFIKEFSLTSQISPQFSTMITVAASSQGAVVGENDTALSKLNKGLTDRYKPAIVNAVNPEPPNTKEALATLTNEYNRMYNPFWYFLQNLSQNKVSDTDIETYKTNYSSIIQKKAEIDKLKDFLDNTKTRETYQGTGFIPFNLSLALDGLSGIKINQQFIMDTSYLPSNYPDSMVFLIKNLSHDIKNNKWTTRIETYAVGKPDESAKGDSSTKDTPVNTTEDDASSSSTTELGPEADFWSLVAIAAAENFIDNPQGMADVAQSIYNRLNAKTYGKSIKELVIAKGQYEPTFINRKDWKAIKDETTAITAYQNSRKTSLATATQAINTSRTALTSPLYKLNAQTFIGSRTEFLATSPTSKNAVGVVERSPSNKNNAFFWNYSGKDIYYSKNKLAATSPPSSVPQLA